MIITKPFHRISLIRKMSHVEELAHSRPYNPGYHPPLCASLNVSRLLLDLLSFSSSSTFVKIQQPISCVDRAGHLVK